MPRGRRAAANTAVTLGIAGSGELDQKAVVALLDDITEGSEVKGVYIPVTDADLTGTIEHVLDWADEKKLPVFTVSDDAAQKDKELKEIIDGAEDDFAAEDSAGKSIVDLLTSSEDDPVEGPKLLMFFDPNEEEDVAVFEAAHEADIPAFDLCDSGSPISFGDDDPAPDPEPEPEPEEKPAGRRGRRGLAIVEPEPDPEPEGDEPAAAELPDRKTLLSWTLVELKRKAKELFPKTVTTETLKGLQKPDVVAILLGETDSSEEAQEPADEAQAEPTTRRRRQAAQEPAEAADEGAGDDDPEADSREAVFARLRGSRETAERIGAGLTHSAKQALELDDEGAEELEKVAGLLAGALMLFADFLVTEVRKPKSAGRPRKDGTEAQPRPPADPTAPPKRRGRPRKDAS